MKNKDQVPGLDPKGNGLNKDDQLALTEGLFNEKDASFIKGSFVQTFASHTAPKFTWDKIEQQLEAAVGTDSKENFTIIKQSFVENFQDKEIPESQWQDIAEEFDKPNDTKSTDLDFVKNSFEQNFNGVLTPLFSWDDLSKRIDQELVEHTAINDTIIKAGFQQYFKSAVPSSNTWQEISDKLDTAVTDVKKSSVAYDALYYFKRIAAVSLLLLLCKTCLLDNEYLSYKGNSTLTEQQVDKDESKPLVVHPQKKKTSKDRPNLSKKNSTLETKNKGTFAQEQNKNIKSLIINSDQSSTSSTAIKNKENNKILSQEIREKSALPYTSIAHLPLQNALSWQHENLTAALLFYQKSITNTASDAALKTIVTATASSKNNASNLNNTKLAPSTNKQNPLVPISSREFNTIQTLTSRAISQPKIAATETVSLLTYKDQNKHKLNIEIGLIGRAGTAMLIGEEALRAHESKSFSSTNIKFAGNFGVILLCNIDRFNSVYFTATPYTGIQQNFGNFTPEGYFLTTNIELSYFDLSLGYQRNIWAINRQKSITKLYARSELNVGFLTHEKTYSSNTTNSSSQYFNQTNIQLGISVGSSHQFKRFTVDYGVSSSLGLVDVVKTKLNNPNINTARLFSVGAYLSLRYNLALEFKSKNPRSGS